MQVAYREVELIKRYPLRISRGEFSGSINLFVSLSDGTVTGLGEAPLNALLPHPRMQHRGPMQR